MSEGIIVSGSGYKDDNGKTCITASGNVSGDGEIVWIRQGPNLMPKTRMQKRVERHLKRHPNDKPNRELRKRLEARRVIKWFGSY